jgi:hypothetical protein
MVSQTVGHELTMRKSCKILKELLKYTDIHIVLASQETFIIGAFEKYSYNPQNISFLSVQEHIIACCMCREALKLFRFLLSVWSDRGLQHCAELHFSLTEKWGLHTF